MFDDEQDNEEVLRQLLGLRESEQKELFHTLGSVRWAGFADFIKCVFLHLSLNVRLEAIAALRLLARRRDRMWLLEISRSDDASRIRWVAFDAACNYIPTKNSDMRLLRKTVSDANMPIDFRISALIAMKDMIRYHAEPDFRINHGKWLLDHLQSDKELNSSALEWLRGMDAIRDEILSGVQISDRVD